MKHGGDYAKRLRHLFNQLIRKYGKPALPEPTDPLEQMIIAILSGNTSHHKALVAFRRLREQMVDLNELRVTPVNELARGLGDSLPQADAKAQRIVDVLNDIRRRHDTLDLSFLKQRGRREAREYLESLEGVDRATAASVTLFSLGGHAIPVDDLILQFLRKDQIVDPAAEAAEVQGFLEHHINASDAAVFCLLLDRYVASRGLRLPEETAGEGKDAAVAGDARPAEKKPVEEAPATPSRSASAGSDNREGKGRASGTADRPSEGPAPRNSARASDRHQKPPPRPATARSGKAAKRR